MREVGQNGLDLIRHVEGTVLHVYLDSRGLPTVGTGHLVRAADGLNVGDEISPERAESLLKADLGSAEACVDRALPYLTQNQFDALCSFVFNVGCTAFLGSQLKHFCDAGNFDLAAEQFQVWTRAGNTHPRGLRIRRLLERDLFLAPDGPMPQGWLGAHDDEP